MRPLRVLFSSPAAEKILHQRAAFFFEHAGSHFDPMVQKIRIADAKSTMYRACTFVRGAVNQTPDARLNQRAGAHRARFNRRIDINAREPVIAELTGGLAQSDDFGVGGRIAVGARAVTGDGDELVAVDNTSSDGHLTAVSGFLSRGQRLPHPVFVLGFRGSVHLTLLPSNSRTATIGTRQKGVKDRSIHRLHRFPQGNLRNLWINPRNLWMKKAEARAIIHFPEFLRCGLVARST